MNDEIEYHRYTAADLRNDLAPVPTDAPAAMFKRRTSSAWRDFHRSIMTSAEWMNQSD